MFRSRMAIVNSHDTDDAIPLVRNHSYPYSY